MTVAWTAPVTAACHRCSPTGSRSPRPQPGPWHTLRWIRRRCTAVIFTGCATGPGTTHGSSPSTDTAPAGRAPRRRTSPFHRALRALRGLRASVGNGRITVAWNTPTNNGGAAILTYRCAAGDRRGWAVANFAVRPGCDARRELHRLAQRHPLLRTGDRGEQRRPRGTERADQRHASVALDAVHAVPAVHAVGWLHGRREYRRRRRQLRNLFAGDARHRRARAGTALTVINGNLTVSTPGAVIQRQRYPRMHQRYGT